MNVFRCFHVPMQLSKKEGTLRVSPWESGAQIYLLAGYCLFDSIVVPTKKRSGLEPKSPEAVFTGTYVHH